MVQYIGREFGGQAIEPVLAYINFILANYAIELIIHHFSCEVSICCDVIMITILCAILILLC